MIKHILFLTCIAFSSFGQIIDIPKAGKWQFVDGTVPPDSSDCQCQDGAPGRGIQTTTVDPVTGEVTFIYTDQTQSKTGPLKGTNGKDAIAPTVNVGTTSQGPVGGTATVTDRDPGPNVILDFVIPTSGSTGGGSSSNQTKNTFDISLGPWNVKDDGITDASPGLQAAINYAAAGNVNGEIIMPPPTNFYRLNSQINVVPVSGAQIWVDIILRGGKAGAIQYYGPSGTSAFHIVGSKNARFEGLNVDLAGNIPNRRAFSIQTPPGYNSSTGGTFKNCFIRLGGAQDAIGIQTGNGSEPNGDISVYNFENVQIYGTGEFNVANVTPGQYGYLNLGSNTLQLQWIGGIVAGCDRAYSNINRAATLRGNGAVTFLGFDGSHNNIDFMFAWEQTYLIEGGRFELGNQFIVVTGNGAFSHVTVENATVHEYNGVNGVIIDIQGQCSLVVDNSTIARVGGAAYASPIRISSGSKFGSLRVTNSSFTSNVVYTKTGAANFAITIKDNVKLGANWQSIDLFSNQ